MTWSKPKAFKRGLPELEIDPKTMVKLYFTYEETAAICRRSVVTIKHLVSKHNLPRTLAPAPPETGKRKFKPGRRFFILLPPETVNALRKITLGF